jgi:polyisoprenoid-binding protein YceI
MKDHVLDVSRFPDAQLEVARADVRLPAAGRPTSGDVTGTLHLHGESRAVHVTYDAAREGNVVHVDGALRLAVGDYGIVVPSYMGISVKPEVDVRVRFDVREQ